MPSRQFVGLCAVAGVAILGSVAWRSYDARQHRDASSAPTVIKQPVVYATRTFDVTAPPSDLPPLTPGESAECDSNFLSNASVAGETNQADSTHATVTITQVKVTLSLNVAVWIPSDASQHVIEHEEGHHQISEYYYQNADKVAERIAGTYMGKQVDITGSDLTAESNKALQQMAGEINDEYGRELNPGPTQLLYDSITDHGRNEVIAKDAIASAIKNVTVASN